MERAYLVPVDIHVVGEVGTNVSISQVGAEAQANELHSSRRGFHLLRRDPGFLHSPHSPLMDAPVLYIQTVSSHLPAALLWLRLYASRWLLTEAADASFVSAQPVLHLGTSASSAPCVSVVSRVTSEKAGSLSLVVLGAPRPLLVSAPALASFHPTDMNALPSFLGVFVCPLSTAQNTLFLISRNLRLLLRFCLPRKFLLGYTEKIEPSHCNILSQFCFCSVACTAA